MDTSARYNGKNVKIMDGQAAVATLPSINITGVEDQDAVHGEINSYTTDEAVEALGFGKFQFILSFLIGLAWTADAMEVMIMSILSPALRCDWWLESWQLALLTTVIFTGMTISGLPWGYISDKYGRKKELIFCSTMTAFYGMLSALAPNFIWLLILRGLVGCSISGSIQAITLHAEYLPCANRGIWVILIQAFWTLGVCYEVLLGLIVMPTLGWRWLLVISSTPLLIFVLFGAWLPESARFHVASGRPDLAAKIFERIAKLNGKPVPQGKLTTNVEGVKRGILVDLFNRQFRRSTILLIFLWVANSFCYFGLILFTTELFHSSNGYGKRGDTVEQPNCQLECHPLTTRDYLDLLWTSVAEFPGLLFTAALVDKLGRKRTIALELITFSIFVFLLYVCTDRTTATIFIFIARAALSGAFLALCLYTPEVYPTTIRSLAVGTCFSIGRIGALTTPFVAQVS